MLRKIKNYCRKNMCWMLDFLYWLKYPFAKEEYCPFCHRQVRLVPGGLPFPRKNACCCYCRSLERHRFLFYVYQVAFLSSVRKQRVLHFAPEEPIWKIISRNPDIDYVCGDIAPEQYPEVTNCRKIDALHIDFPDGYFDVVIANHLIEHVDEDLFLKELKRVLKDDGKALLSTPVYMELEQTLENPEYNTPALKRKYYGHHEHLRKYGRDTAERFSRHFSVSMVKSDSIPPYGDPVNSNCFILEKTIRPD